MTLAWQISIIDDLIRENPDVRIKDYLEVIAEMQQIEEQVNIKTMPQNKVPMEAKEKILRLAKKGITPSRIAAQMLYGSSTIYRVLKEMEYDVWQARDKRKLKAIEELKMERAGIILAGCEVVIEPNKGPRSGIKRPAAEYSNSGFLATTQKYA